LADGLAQFSRRTLARAVGVSHATLLHHFVSKDQLLEEIVELLARQELHYWATVTQEAEPLAIAQRVGDRYSSERPWAHFGHTLL